MTIGLVMEGLVLVIQIKMVFGKERLICKKVYSLIYTVEIIGLITKKYLFMLNHLETGVVHLILTILIMLTDK